MIPSIWRLCLWLIDTVAIIESSSIVIKQEGSFISASESNKKYLVKLISSLYSIMPSIRETISTSLLSKCYTPVSENNAIVTSLANSIKSRYLAEGLSKKSIYKNTNASQISLPPLGYSSSYSTLPTLELNEQRQHQHPHPQQPMSQQPMSQIPSLGMMEKTRPFQNQSSWKRDNVMSNTQKRYLRAQAQLSILILLSLSTNHLEIGSLMMTSLINRLTPASDGRVVLPTPIVTHR